MSKRLIINVDFKFFSLPSEWRSLSIAEFMSQILNLPEIQCALLSTSQVVALLAHPIPDPDVRFGSLSEQTRGSPIDLIDKTILIRKVLGDHCLKILFNTPFKHVWSGSTKPADLDSVLAIHPFQLKPTSGIVRAVLSGWVYNSYIGATPDATEYRLFFSMKPPVPIVVTSKPLSRQHKIVTTVADTSQKPRTINTPCATVECESEQTKVAVFSDDLSDESKPPSPYNLKKDKQVRMSNFRFASRLWFLWFFGEAFFNNGKTGADVNDPHTCVIRLMCELEGHSNNANLFFSQSQWMKKKAQAIMAIPKNNNGTKPIETPQALDRFCENVAKLIQLDLDNVNAKGTEANTIKTSIEQIKNKMDNMNRRERE